jgi:hypothetical protein
MYITDLSIGKAINKPTGKIKFKNTDGVSLLLDFGSAPAVHPFHWNLFVSESWACLLGWQGSNIVLEYRAILLVTFF